MGVEIGIKQSLLVQPAICDHNFFFMTLSSCNLAQLHVSPRVERAETLSDSIVTNGNNFR